MRRLLLLRHAKAERSQAGGSDRDRVLTDRGRADARKVGGYLARHGFVPDHALVSPAARTRETWALVAEAFEKPPAASYEDAIYESSPQDILTAIQNGGGSANTLLVVGHNPSLQEIAALLIAAGDVEPRQRLNEDFPTSALAVIGLAAGDWRDLHAHAGRLEHFVTPKSLEPATD
jgi:phosphohistidine phosphatase